MRLLRFGNKGRKGTTLLEAVISIAILMIVVVSIYQAFSVLLDIFETSDLQVAVTSLSNELMEVIWNMPYDSVGTVGGVPSGILPQAQVLTRGINTFLASTTVRNVDDPFDGTAGGSPNDNAPADYKLVELSIVCTTCLDNRTFEFTGRIAPRNLEAGSNNGSLFIQVIDANGQGVSGATVTVLNSTVSPAVNVTDVTDSTGLLQVIGVPPSVQSYNITASKSGYSTDQTYVPTIQNPNPTKLPATVLQQTVTQISFAIDRVSQLNVSSLTDICSPVPSTSFTLTGTKLIGTSPDVPKFSQNFTTNSSGLRTVSNLEWDSYNAIVSNSNYDVSGMIPYLPINLAPNSTQNFKIILAPKNPLAFLVTVKDLGTQLPLSNATVTLTSSSYSNNLATGRGFLRQTDWSGGAGQDLFINQSQYFSDDGNIDVLSPVGEIKLKLVASSTYASSGTLESSTFDTGSASNFYNFTWSPGSQPPDTGADSVKFQFASATTTSPQAWNFIGPDGTSASYFTSANTNINSIHNNDQYFRYKAFLQTASTTFTPSVSDIAVTFASSCVPPGQVIFNGLAADTYTLTVQLTGYQTFTDNAVIINSPWQEYPVNLSQ